jgi:peptide-methionine (S)-S-oxide reductase
MRTKITWLALLVLGIAIVAVAWARGLFAGPEAPPPPPPGARQATFASGCFWCTEAVFQRVNGVHSVVSGYTGGTTEHPTYQEVCTGRTGHAEAVQVTYDPGVVSYAELLEVFWTTHDPTTLNKQGHDEGTQYRSAIFYHSDEQQRLAEEYKKKLDAESVFAAPIVTEIVPFTLFYPAEKYHQDFYNQNPQHRYCRIVIEPKLEKFAKVFGSKRTR